MIAEFKGYSKCAGVYKIHNTITDKFYIGSTSSLRKRHYQHSKALEEGKHSNKHLQNSYTKYGKSAFKFEVLEVVLEDIENNLRISEQKLLDLYWDDCVNCYNIEKRARMKIGRKIPKGRKFTEEHKQKISESNKGKKLSDEHKQKLRDNAKSNPNYGMRNKKCSTTHKKRISKSRMGKKHWFYGKPMPEQQLEKMRQEYKVVLLSPEGVVYFGFIGLKKFASTHNLSVSGLAFLVKGERKSHKGWVKLPKSNFLVQDRNHPSKWIAVDKPKKEESID